MWGKLLTDTYNRVRTKADEVRQQVSSTVQAQHATISKAREVLLSLGSSSGRVESRAHAIAQAAETVSAEELLTLLQRDASGVRTVDEVHELLLLWRMLTLQAPLHGAPRFFSAEYGDQERFSGCSPARSGEQVEGDLFSSLSSFSLNSAFSSALAASAKSDSLPGGEAGRAARESGEERNSQENRERGDGGHAALPHSAVAVPPPARPSFAQELRDEAERGEQAVYGDGLSFKEILLRSNALERCLLAIARRGSLRAHFATHTQDLLEARREARRRFEKRQASSDSPSRGVSKSAESFKAKDVSAVSEKKVPFSAGASEADSARQAGDAEASEERAAEGTEGEREERGEGENEKHVAAPPPSPALDAVLSLMSLCLAGSQQSHLELLHSLLRAAEAAAAAGPLSTGRRLEERKTPDRAENPQELRKRANKEDRDPEEEKNSKEVEEKNSKEVEEKNSKEEKLTGDGRRLTVSVVEEGVEVLETTLQLVTTWKRSWVLERKEDARRRLEAEARHLAAKIEDCGFRDDAEEEDPLVTHNIRLLANAQLLDLQQRIICVKEQLLQDQAEEAQRKLAALAKLKSAREALTRNFEDAGDAVEQQKKDVQMRMSETSEVLLKEAAGLEERRTTMRGNLEKLKREREDLEQRLAMCIQKIAAVQADQADLQAEEEGLHLDLLHVQKEYKDQIHLHQVRRQQQSELCAALRELDCTGASLVDLLQSDAAKKKEAIGQDVDRLKGALQTQVCRHLAFEKTRLQQQVQFLLQCMQTLESLHAEGEKRLAARREVKAENTVEERAEGRAGEKREDAEEKGEENRGEGRKGGEGGERRRSDDFECVSAFSAEEQAVVFGVQKRLLRGCRQLDNFYAETEQFVSLHRDVLVGALRQQQQSFRHRQEEASEAASLGADLAQIREVDPMKDLTALYRQTKKQLVPYLTRLSTTTSRRDRPAAPRGAPPSSHPSHTPSSLSSSSSPQTSAPPPPAPPQPSSQMSSRSIPLSPSQSTSQSSSQSVPVSSSQAVSQSVSHSSPASSSPSLSGSSGAEVNTGRRSSGDAFPFDFASSRNSQSPAVENRGSESERQELKVATPSPQVFDLKTPPRSPGASPEQGEKMWGGDEGNPPATAKVDNWLLE
ncbi:UNVERIFIED_CONTAM: hypothetical protein HHA_224980 [Hammondia hammondi]|eukprot:XP_008881876.1 hypothetical protein HHA_224980 [Hammondia hammondi]